MGFKLGSENRDYKNADNTSINRKNAGHGALPDGMLGPWWPIGSLAGRARKAQDGSRIA